MQETSAKYRRIMSGPHWFETSLALGSNDRLTDQHKNVLVVGGVCILTSTTGPDFGYKDALLISIRTSNHLVQKGKLIGNTISGQIEVQMLDPCVDIPRMARMVPYIRAVNDTEKSEWIPKGVYYIDTRQTETIGDQTVLTLTGYDALLFAESDYTGENLSWPATDLQVVQDIANVLGVRLDPATRTFMNKGYTIQLPSGYSQREVLGYIAGMYASNFTTSSDGMLRMISPPLIPSGVRYLSDGNGYALEFGGDRILV